MSSVRSPLQLALVAALGVAFGLVLAWRTPIEAQRDAPSLPTSCSRGQVVVSEGFNRFRCVDARSLLGLDRCSSGDFVRYENGELRCTSVSGCFNGGILTLDTFGRASCAPPLPECSRGRALVSDGRGWTCGDR